MIRATALAVAAILVSTGCAARGGKARNAGSDSRPDVKIVAILPFMDHTGRGEVPVDEFAEIFASEILKFEGFRVVRPRAVAGTMREGESLRTFEDAARIGRRVKADAVIAAAVTDYDPYRPPRVGIAVQFLRLSAREVGDAEIDLIVRSASWRHGPLSLGRSDAGHWMSAFEKVYDADQDRVRHALAEYVERHGGRGGPFRDGGEFVAVQSKFMQFVSHQVIQDVMARAD